MKEFNKWLVEMDVQKELVGYSVNHSAAKSYAHNAPNPEGVKSCAEKIAKKKGWSEWLTEYTQPIPFAARVTLNNSLPQPSLIITTTKGSVTIPIQPQYAQQIYQQIGMNMQGQQPNMTQVPK